MMHRLLLVAFFALLSIKKVQLAQLRGCSAQEVQDLADCITTDTRADDDMTEMCYKVNLCPRDYFYQKYGQYNDNNNNRNNFTSSGNGVDQFKNISVTVLDQCVNDLRNKVQQLIVSCVQKDPQMANVGFQYPKIDDGENNQSGGYNVSYGNMNTCNENRLTACLAGRDHSNGICPVMKKCAKDHCAKCDMALTSNVLCKCANKTFQERFDEMKANFTKCLNQSSTWTFTLTAEEKQQLIDHETSTYCMNCFPPTTSCTIEDVYSTIQCVEGTTGNIDQCYRTSNCPKPMDDRDEKFEAHMKNITLPFGSVNQSKLPECGMSVQLEIIKQIGECIKKKIPTIDLSQLIKQGNDSDSRDHVDDTNHYNQSYVLQGSSCNQTILNACLAGRKWNADKCEIEDDCGHCSSNCDYPQARSVACACAQQILNVNTFPTYFAKLSTCMGIASPPTLDDQTKNMLMNGVLIQFCDCVPGFNVNGPSNSDPPPSGQPKPVRILPKNPNVAPSRPPTPATPSPVAAQFVGLLKGKGGRRRR